MYLKRYINFLENTEVTENTILVKINVTSVYANIPRRKALLPRQ